MNQATAKQALSVRLFGAFRQFGEDSSVNLVVPPAACIADLRQALQNHFGDNDNALALLEASAFATDQAILQEDDQLPPGEQLSIIPPVCGG